jgi:signal transduction histidine kinase
LAEQTSRSRKKLKRVGFYKYFEPFDCFIGAGEDLVDFENEIKQKLIKEIQEIRFKNNGYIFMLDYNGTVLTHINKSFIGKDFTTMKDKNNRNL